MNQVLVDTSVWIEYFAGNDFENKIDKLIDEGKICTNKIILCELIPFLKFKNEIELIDLLNSIDIYPLNINWEKIIDYQTKNVKNNLKKIGIPDLLILENVLDNNLELYTYDKHFNEMQKLHKLKLYTK
jgi:predicted nucleic acid-binding protein